jgi:hypothetical protein
MPVSWRRVWGFGATRADIPFMVEAAARTAWATDKGMTIAMGVVTALREARILLPSISTIERASSAGRARARKQAAHALIADLSAEQVQALDQLFDAAGGMSHLALLKTIPVAAKPDHIRQILDRLRQVRKIGISPTSRAASTRTDFGNMSGKAVRRLPI